MTLKANTPLKRIGLVLLVLYAFCALCFAVCWNIAEKPFFYKTNNWQYLTPPKPSTEKDIEWERNAENSAWFKIDKKCNDEQKKVTKKLDLSTLRDITPEEFKNFIPTEPTGVFNKNGDLVFSHKCIISRFEDSKNYRWESSFSDFVEEFLNYWPQYIILFIGILLFFGLIDKWIYILKNFYLWVKTGYWEKDQVKKKPGNARLFLEFLWIKSQIGRLKYVVLTLSILAVSGFYLYQNAFDTKNLIYLSMLLMGQIVQLFLIRARVRSLEKDASFWSFFMSCQFALVWLQTFDPTISNLYHVAFLYPNLMLAFQKGAKKITTP